MVATPASPRRDSGLVSGSDRAEPAFRGSPGADAIAALEAGLARIAGTVGLELAWNNWGPLNVN